MNKYLKLSAIAAGLLASGMAYADPAETKGGIKVKTEDGRFEASIGGRIQFDHRTFMTDGDATNFGSGATGFAQDRGGFNFRRAYMTLGGKLYGFKYKFEYDLAGSTSNPASTFRELWISTNVGPGEVFIGQFKPYRGMEELTSSNEITMIERPVTSASGIYNGRQFLAGVGYKGIMADQLGYSVSYQGLTAAGGTSTEGFVAGTRLYWFPFSGEGETLHVALSHYVDKERGATGGTSNTGSFNTSFTYGGRVGQALTIAQVGNNQPGVQATTALELAGSIGPVTLQGEYARANYSNAYTFGGTSQTATVQAYYAQASWFVTGESKQYKKDRGAFGSPKPNNDFGAVELTARYETIANLSTSVNSNAGCTITGATTADDCAVRQATVGANWYVNPNVRFMMNYYMAQANLGRAGADRPEAFTVRTQLSF